MDLLRLVLDPGVVHVDADLGGDPAKLVADLLHGSTFLPGEHTVHDRLLSGGFVSLGGVVCSVVTKVVVVSHGVGLPRSADFYAATVIGMRMFVAVVPPDEALEDLGEFLAPRQEAESGFRWTVPDQWHVTLAFMHDVPDRALDDLVARLARAAARRTPFTVSVAGGGAFPNAGRAKVLFAGLDVSDPEELRRLKTGARAAAGKAGAEAEGGRFHPHLTLARIGRPLDVTKWIRVLEAYRGPTWTAQEISLIESHLGEGPRKRPRYEVLESFRLGRSAT